MAKADLTAQRLRELLVFNEESGEFFRRVWRGGTSLPGARAGGSHGKTGYRQISLDNRLYFEHRLVWFWYHGKWPDGVIDHIDGNPTNNRISNLRDVSQAKNTLNHHRKRKNASPLPIGVTYRQRIDRYVAQISVNKKGIYLGCFRSAEEAGDAYLEAKKRFHVI